MAGNKRKRAQLKPTKPRHRHALHSHSDDDATLVSSKSRNRAPKHHQEEDQLLSSKLSAKILKEAHNLQREIAEEVDGDGKVEPLGLLGAVGVGIDEAEGSESDDLSEIQTQFDAEEFEIDPEDERILEAFMKKDVGPQPTLADIIARKIQEKGEEGTSH